MSPEWSILSQKKKKPKVMITADLGHLIYVLRKLLPNANRFSHLGSYFDLLQSSVGRFQIVSEV